MVWVLSEPGNLRYKMHRGDVTLEVAVQTIDGASRSI